MKQGSIRKADRVSSDLLRQIVGGMVQPGDLLPKEDSLAETYGVNRSVVREAVKLLEVHRLVRPIKRKGTIALNPMGSMSPEVIHAMLSPRPGEIDVAVLKDVLEIRTHLDVEMSAMAADRRSEQDMENLDTHFRNIEESRLDAQAYSDALEAFTLSIAAATGNRIYGMMVHWNHRVHAQLDDLMASVRQPSNAHLAGMKILIELIRKQDSESVRTVVRAFHGWATPRILTAAALRSGTALEDINDLINAT